MIPRTLLLMLMLLMLLMLLELMVMMMRKDPTACDGTRPAPKVREK